MKTYLNNQQIIELNDLITEKVFQEIPCRHKKYVDECGSWCSVNCDNMVSLNYVTNMQHCYFILKKLNEGNVLVNLKNDEKSGLWECEIGKTKTAQNHSIAVAICLAALLYFQD